MATMFEPRPEIRITIFFIVEFYHRDWANHPAKPYNSRFCIAALLLPETRPRWKCSDACPRPIGGAPAR